MGRDVGAGGGDAVTRVVAAMVGVLVTAAAIAAAVAFFAVAATLVAAAVAVGIALAIWRRLRGPRASAPRPRARTGDVIDVEARPVDESS